MQSGSRDLIFGINAVRETLKGRSPEIVEILLAESANRELLWKLREAAGERNVSIRTVSIKVLDRLASGQRHQGVIARVEAYRYLPFTELLERVAAPEGKGRILVLDGITDPRNFGALIRTADAAGVRQIVISKDRSADVTPLVTRAAAGATAYVSVTKVANLRRALMELKKRGFWIVGLEAGSGPSIYETTFPAKLAILLGSEGSGVRPINLRECDFVVSIPMLGGVASLNVSVACAVLLYELLRQNLAG